MSLSPAIGLSATYRAVILILLLFCISRVHVRAEPGGASGVLMVGSETFLSEESQQSEMLAKLKGINIDMSPELTIMLPPISDSELSILEARGEGKRVRVGLGREIPEPYSDSMTAVIAGWKAHPDGGQVAAFSVTSPAAGALRLKLFIASAPEGLELRFFNPSEPGTSVGPFGADALMQERSMHSSVVSADYWSPTIQGDTLAVEIYLPPNTSPESFVFSTPRLSHLMSSPLQSSLFFKNLSDIGSSASCNIDIACIEGLDTQAAASVAKYLFTGSDGYSYICTGTLVNDTNPDSLIPYFLTAQHCVSKQSEAASAEFYWFFQRSGCDSSVPSTVTRQVGGGELLLSLANVDMSLLKLRTPPPNGVSLSGWSSEGLTSGIELLGIHHPNGDLKKGSLGRVNGFAELFAQPDGRGAFIQVTWNNGVTEPGSSGSGIWRQIEGASYLVGTLTGGASACDSRSSPDYYGRFDLAFPSLQRFLAPDTGNAEEPDFLGGRLLNISSNGFVDDGGVVAGFIITGGARRVVVMGERISSSLDPVIQLTDENGVQVLYENNNWQSDVSADEVIAKLRAPLNLEDAAFAITLPPGVYLAKLSGVDGTVGRGVVSITEVDQ